VADQTVRDTHVAHGCWQWHWLTESDIDSDSELNEWIGDRVMSEQTDSVLQLQLPDFVSDWLRE